jgi:hypothetical protein
MEQMYKGLAQGLWVTQIENLLVSRIGSSRLSGGKSVQKMDSLPAWLKTHAEFDYPPVLGVPKRATPSETRSHASALHVYYRAGLSPSAASHPSWFYSVASTKFQLMTTPRHSNSGHAITQAVGSWFHTAAARVRARVKSCGICGGQSGTGAGFLRVLRFPLQIFIPPIAPQTPSSRTKWTHYHPTKSNKNKIRKSVPHIVRRRVIG